MICKWCGSILDECSQHTSDWIKSWVSKGKPQRARLYRVWGSLRERCNNPKQCRYHDYGGRGISVCEEWDDYTNFREWALSAGWKPGLQIDRRDNDKGYSPQNCKIVNRFQQQQNRRLPSRNKTGKRYNCRELTANDIYEIRDSKLPRLELAKQYDVDATMILKIQNGLTWTHLPKRRVVV